MKYSELEGTSMYLYLTLTDIPLFTQTEAQGKVLLDEINRRETDEVVKKALELVTRGELEPDQLMTYALDHLGENYDKKFEEVMSENEDIVDVNKYLLIGAYRNLRLLELLNDPENFEIFPPLEKFRGFKRVYAETAVRIADILKDTDVRVDYDVNEEGHEYGIWNDVTREFESIHFSVEDLMRNIIENPLVKEALESELDTKALENRELSGGIVYDLESDDPFRVSGSSNVERLLSIKALNNQFLRVKRNSEEKKYKNPGQMTIKEFQEHVESTEEDRIRILEKAIGRNGVTILDNKIFMVNDSKEFQMPKSDYELLKTSIRREAKNVERDSRVKNFTADDIVNLCTLLDVAFSVPDFSKDDEIFGLATKILDNLRQRADKDKDFEKLLREYMENYTIVLEDRLNLENAALNTSLYAMKKFGEDEAIHRKYKEMEESNKSKIILLYTRGLLPFEFMKEAGYLNSYYSNSEIMDYYKDGLINKEQTREFMYLSNNNDPQVSESDYIKGLYASAREIKDKKLRDSISRKYFDLLDGKETLQLFAEGYIYTRELYKKNLTVDDVLRCKKEVILSIINTNDKELPKSIVPTEEQIIDLYGKKFSGKDLIDIANNGKLSTAAGSNNITSTFGEMEVPFDPASVDVSDDVAPALPSGFTFAYNFSDTL